MFLLLTYFQPSPVQTGRPTPLVAQDAQQPAPTQPLQRTVSCRAGRPVCAQKACYWMVIDVLRKQNADVNLMGLIIL